MARGLFDLHGKVVLATGSNSGIGLGFLQGCAKQGADVVVWGRRAEKNGEAVAALKALGAPRAHAESVDVADEVAVEAAFASTLKAMGRVDCLFANAGFSQRAPSFSELSSQMYHGLLGVALHGAFTHSGLRPGICASEHKREIQEVRSSLAGACRSFMVCRAWNIMRLQRRAGCHDQGTRGRMGPYGVRANMLVPGFVLTGFSEGKPETEALIKRFSAITPPGAAGFSIRHRGACGLSGLRCIHLSNRHHAGDRWRALGQGTVRLQC
jgi:short subunit dehydrogenase